MKQIFILTVFLSVFANAQKFKPAAVTFNDNEKVTGNVAYNNPSLTPQSFQLLDSSEQSKTLGLKEIKEVEIKDNTRFIKTEIEISRHAENLQNLEQNKNFNIKKEERFIEQIVFGKYNLYKYADHFNKAYYYSSADSDGIKPLLYKEYFLENGDKTSNKDYLNILQKINCGNNDYTKVGYLESSLTNYFNKINNCNGETNTDYQKPKGYIEHKVYAIYTHIKQANQTGFGGGYEIEYHLPVNNYSFAFAAAPSFELFTKKQNLPIYSYTTSSLLSLPLLARYYAVKTNDLKIYASYSIMNLSEINNTFIGYNNEEEKSSNFTAFENNFFELGVRFKSLEAFARFHSRAFDNAISLGLKYNFYSTKK